MSMWASAISVLRRELMTRMEQIPSSLFGWTLTAKSSPMGDADEVRVDDEGKGQRPSRRIEPWGHRGRSPSGVRSFWIRLGSSNVLFMGVAPSKGYGPSDLEDGETALYSAEVEKGVHLTEDGDNKLASKTGKTVQVNGDDYSMLKTETLLADLASFLGTINPANTGGPILNDGGTFKTNMITSLGNGSYKSTKAKNG